MAAFRHNCFAGIEIPGRSSLYRFRLDQTNQPPLCIRQRLIRSSCFFAVAILALLGLQARGEHASLAGLKSPQAGRILRSTSETFSWTAGHKVTAYRLFIGTEGKGSHNVYNLESTKYTSETVNSLPKAGATIYVTLSSKVDDVWKPVYYVYTKAGLKALSCASKTMTGQGTDSCTVSLNVAAPRGGARITVSTNSSAVVVPSSVTVPANATTVKFLAAVSPVVSARTVELVAAAGGTSKLFDLRLGVAARDLALNASSVAFGTVKLNTVATQSIVLASTGTQALDISALTISGRGFSLVGAKAPVTLAPNSRLTLSVEFDPTVAGAASGQLIIATDSSDGVSPIVTLTGTGQDGGSYEVELNWDAPATSPVPVAGYNVYRAPGGTSTFELLNSSADAQTSYADTTVQDGQAYDYMIESVDSQGDQSAPTSVVSVVVP